MLFSNSNLPPSSSERFYTVCYLSLKSTIRENSRHCINKLRFCFTIDESYQVEISRKNHAVPGLFFSNCSGDEVDISYQKALMAKGGSAHSMVSPSWSLARSRQCSTDFSRFQIKDHTHF